MTEFKKPKCPKCGSVCVRTRATDKKHVCIRCANEWKEEK